MEQSPGTANDRHAPDSGRAAVPEIAELLHIQRPAAAVAAAAVVLVGLLITLFAPSVLPANPLTGLGVGVVALLAAVVAAVVLDGRDPVVRGPRHLRRDGHNVLGRMTGPDPDEHAAPVLQALERRLAERDHISMLLTGTGTDASELAEALGRGAAGDGHTSLVIDLRAAGAPGVSDVGAGRVRLGEAATLAQDRPYAWIGAGADREAAVAAAAGVARRPPRDLQLLLVVAPDAATPSSELLRACDRTVLLVAADTQQREMVSTRLQALARAGGTPEAVVVGGLQVAVGDEPSTGPVDDGRATGWAPSSGVGIIPASEAPTRTPPERRPSPFEPAAPAAPSPPSPQAARPAGTPAPAAPPPSPEVPSPDDTRPADDPADSDTTDAAATGDAAPVDDLAVDERGGTVGHVMDATDDAEDATDDVEGSPAAVEDATDDIEAEAHDAEAATDATEDAADTEDATDDVDGATDAPRASVTGPSTHFVDLDGLDGLDPIEGEHAPEQLPDEDARGSHGDDTGPIEPITSHASDSTESGFSTPDPLSTTVALDRFLHERRPEN